MWSKFEYPIFGYRNEVVGNYSAMSSLTDVVTHAALMVLRGLLVSQFQFLPYNFDTNKLAHTTYDFIVVGSGCGGSVVASRLSETSARVLLLEAGGSAPPETVIPGLTPVGINTEIYSNIKPVPEKHAQFGYQNNSGFAPVGRVMGGSTTINGMIYGRGSKKDYDGWARMGNPGWDYDSVLPYFLKSENFSGQPLPGMEGHHHRGGPLTVENRKMFSRAGKAFMDGARQLGYKLVDGSGPDQIGFAPVYVTTKAGVRVTASEAFLRPVVDRPNLDIRPKAFVTKILFDNTKRAVGVEYIFNGKRRTARARKEVILSAGAIFTPQLLMLSGVGPRRHLEEMGIPLVAAVEGVGQNMNDHPMLPLSVKVKNYGGPRNLVEHFSLPNLITYIRTGEGQLAYTATTEATGWIYAGGEDPTRSDVQIYLSQMALLKQGEMVSSSMGIKPEISRDGEQIGAMQETVSMLLTVNHPKSRGSVKLASTDPNRHPAVHFNYFDHPDDFEFFVRGIRTCQKLIATPAMRDSIQATLTNELTWHCGHHGKDSDSFWRCYIRYFVDSMRHYSGTAKMAPDFDPMGVVSPRLRVRGVSGLRVVDASIMPQIVSANIMSTAYMIGEKGADMIKKDWGYSVDPLPGSNMQRRVG